MKRAILAGATLLSLMGAAVAADLGVAPVSQPSYAPGPVGWGGFYLGGHAGYGWANRDGLACWDGILSPVFSVADCSDGGFFDYDQEGWLAGGQIGYNYMFNNNFLIGLEVDGSLADIDGPQISPDLFPGDGEWTWLATATARLGYAVDLAATSVLVYAEGGLGLGGFDYDGSLGCNFSQNRSGYVVGGGAEVKISQRASLKAEYNFMDFGNESQLCGALGGFLPTYTEADADMHVVKIGFNYLLGGQ